MGQSSKAVIELGSRWLHRLVRRLGAAQDDVSARTPRPPCVEEEKSAMRCWCNYPRSPARNGTSDQSAPADANRAANVARDGRHAPEPAEAECVHPSES